MKTKIIIYVLLFLILIQKVFGNFYISEILPNTDDDTIDEYVGIIYDGSGSNSLSGYTLSDLSGKEYIFNDDFFENSEVKKYYRTTTKILLNDTNETLYLKDNSGILVDTFSYAITENNVIIYKKNEDIETPLIDESTQTGNIIETEIETNSGVIIEVDEEPIEDIFTDSGSLNDNSNSGSIIIDDIETDSGSSLIGDELSNDTGSLIMEEQNNSGTIIDEIITSSGIINDVIITNLNIKNAFQSPTYLNEKDIELKNNLVYNCDRTKDDCRVNLDLRNTFSTIIKESDFDCNIDFSLGAITGEENKCNPNTIIFPVGVYDIKIKVTNKNDSNYFGNLNFRIINDGKLITQTQTITNYVSTSSTYTETSKLVLKEPIIKLQSGLDDKQICNKKECNINFDSEISDKDVICNWDFGSGSFNSGNDKKCNPSSVGFSSGIHNISLQICDKNDENNCKKTIFTFENIYKKIPLQSIISLQGKLTKNKTLEGKKITCFLVDSCSINLTGGDSKGEDLSYFWDFGDDDYSESKNPLSKVFKKGIYTVILEISDNDGEISEDILEIEVKGKDSDLAIVSEENVNVNGEKSLSSINTIKIHSLKIELQGKLGENKILKDNKLTCIKTCSVNFDGGKSIGDFESYSWDFGNGETYIGVNPGYVNYKNPGNYNVLFLAEDNDGNIYEKEFFVNYIEKLQKNSDIVPKTQAFSSKEENANQIDEQYIENNLQDLDTTKEKSNSAKFIIGLFIVISSILSYILMLRYKII
ncbi:MAG: PKD domain-containing protein [Candidatus Gracilibacteria bacterium]|nr:PKD domain-containing protein [Candidatus Gracilibacteria bacterium]